jgi:propionyl-CoA synthetase
MSKPTRSLEFCRRALEQREDFWTEQAEAIHWQKPFDQVCDFSRPPFAKWFVGGETNLCYNAIDRHLASRANQPALHYISTEIDAERSFTYRELYDEVCRFAAVLQSLGLTQGDRVIIYLPMIPEAAFAMLACVRLGLVHSVVFAGFAPASIATRIDDAEARLVITSDAGLRGGKVIPLKRLVDEAISIARFQPEHVLLCNRRIETVTPAIFCTPPGQLRHRRVFSGIRAATLSRWRLRCDTCLPEHRAKPCSRRQISGGRWAIRTAFTAL